MVDTARTLPTAAAPRVQKERRTFPNPIGRILLWVAVIAVIIWVLFPFFWAVVTSFKSQMDALTPTFIPGVQFTPTLENWTAELGLGWPETSAALRNSVIIALGSTLVACTLGTLTGYALARFSFRVGNGNLISWVLSQRFLPPIATFIPVFVMLQSLRLLNTHLGMIVVNTTFVLPFAILIMRDFFADFPSELEDAALVDGAGPLGVFFRIALPLARPALTAAAIICFAFAWNEYLFASVLATQNAVKPYTFLVASTSTVRGVHFGYLATRLLIAVTLPVLLSLFVQRYIVRGLTLGAVKG